MEERKKERDTRWKINVSHPDCCWHICIKPSLIFSATVQTPSRDGCTASFIHTLYSETKKSFCKTQCLKITEKSLIQHCERSELRLHFEWTKVSYKYQKWWIFASFLKNWSLRSNSVTSQVTFNRTKIGGKCPNWNIEMRHFEWFSNIVERWVAVCDPPKLDSRFSSLFCCCCWTNYDRETTPPLPSHVQCTLFIVSSDHLCTFNKERCYTKPQQNGEKNGMNYILFSGWKFLWTLICNSDDFARFCFRVELA